MYGLIGKMIAEPGKRDELLAIMLENDFAMPGCLSYVIAKDPSDANGIWVSEVWTDQASHQASLGLASVKALIGRARPLIAGFETRIETEPAGGLGLRA